MSLLKHLDRRNNYDPTRNEEIAEPKPRIPLFQGRVPLTVEQYSIELTDSNDTIRRAYNNTTGETLRAHFHDHAAFHLKAHLLLANVQGVCSVCDVKRTDEGVFVLTQNTYGDLHGYLRKKKRLSEHEAAPLFQQIVTMVVHAHRQRIALRDIKLKKFVFTNKSRTNLALAQLDNAQLMDSSGLLTDKHGCPAYICPEKLQSDCYSGKAADLWSLGVILYTLLVGNYPFFDNTPQELFSKVRTGYYQVPEHVSYLARSLISSLLTYDPAQRVSALAVLEHPWFKCIALESEQYLMSDQIVPMK